MPLRQRTGTKRLLHLDTTTDPTAATRSWSEPRVVVGRKSQPRKGCAFSWRHTRAVADGVLEAERLVALTSLRHK